MNAEIYYVEDDVDIAESENEYLEQRNFSVAVISSLSRAKEMLLIDVSLSDGNGITLCE